MRRGRQPVLDRSSFTTDAQHRRTDWKRFTGLRKDLQDHPVVGTGDLRVDLVGRHLEQRIVEFDLVPDLFEDGADHAFGDGFTQFG